jgi:hypothetical protein
MADNDKNEALYAEIIDDIPESFWKTYIWSTAGELILGKLDVAERKKMVIRVLEEVRRRDEETKADSDPAAYAETPGTNVFADPETPECVATPRDISLVPPNSWLDDGVVWCPTCRNQVQWGSVLPDREYKLQHQLWHYHVAQMILPGEHPLVYGGGSDKPDQMPE